MVFRAPEQEISAVERRPGWLETLARNKVARVGM